jgi:hypothetical protein
LKRLRLALSIRAKMLLVSCVLFAIPWIAYLYAGELERILRENQEAAVLNTARAIATALNDRPSLFHALGRDATTDGPNDIVAYKLPRPIGLDGRLDDWMEQGVELRALGLLDDVLAAPTRSASTLRTTSASASSRPGASSSATSYPPAKRDP